MRTKYVRCREDHKAIEYPVPKKIKTSCANCQGEHPANYRECPKMPKLITKTAYTVPGTSYAMKTTPQARNMTKS